jgi:CheY-like chemotaxis protein
MKKILVIDDAEFILESTSSLLEFEGYDVITAENGAIGVKKAFESLPDLILCDISMPEMDGFEVLEQIRKNDNTHRIPFIFLTAFNEKSNMRDGMTKGADDYLVKPYTREEIVKAIEAQWSKYNLFQEHVKTKVEEVGKNVTYALPHEFRTAVNEIKGNAGILYNQGDLLNPEELKSLSGDILASVSRLSKITENYLLYIKLDNIKSDNEEYIADSKTEEPFAIACDIAYNLAEKYSRLSDIQIGKETEAISLKMSSEYFYSLIYELIDNAMKFSKKGDKVLLDSDINDSSFVLKIIDNGIGIDKDKVKNIAALNQFDREKNEQQGLGLGLAISTKIINLHNGKYDIESDSTGTKFIITLPCFKS